MYASVFCFFQIPVTMKIRQTVVGKTVIIIGSGPHKNVIKHCLRRK